jgi:hypothetical protein
MGTALAHMLHADAEATDTPDSRTGQPAVLRFLPVSLEDRVGPIRSRPEADQDRSESPDQDVPVRRPKRDSGGSRPARPQTDQARLVAHRLVAAGKPVSGRALRSGGVMG